YSSSGYFYFFECTIESVGSSFLRVIHIGSISVKILVALEVGAAAVASPAGVLKRYIHSSSKADPSESSPPPVSVAPMVSTFLCLDDSESDTEMPERHVSPTPYDAMITRWRSREDIPIGRLYRTHPGGPCRALTTRKSVRPLPSYRLALRTPRCSEAYLCWRSASLSTMYPLMTSDSSAGNSSSKLSAGPFRKRCRSPAAIMTSYIPATIALVPYRADLLPPHKRFRDSISLEDSVEEDIDTDVLEDIDADATIVEVALDRDVVTKVDAGIDMEVDVGVDVEDEVDDEVESSDRGTMKVGVDVAAGIDIPDGMLMHDDVERLEQRELEARSLIASGERASLLDQVASLERSNVRIQDTMMMERARANRFWRHVSFTESELRQIRRFCYYDKIRFRRLETFANMAITHSGMSPEAIEALVNQPMEEALVAYEVTPAANVLEAENQSQNGSDGDNGNGGNRNGGDGNGGNGNPNKNNRGTRPVARECTYQDFMSRTIRVDAAFSMSWRELMKLMAEVYCPRTEIQKMESELWNLIVKNNDLSAYTQRFQELTMMCTKMVPEEEN
nr:reverse transcriptase domain-containing protein [Tanacetum cinerariifolium]